MTLPRLRIIHETNPEKYFPALFLLADHGEVSLTGAHRYSVFKEWLRAWRRDRAPLGARTRNAWQDLLFRLRIPAISEEVIVIGFAPWDWRLLIYRALARKNRILYHTSWHDWRIDRTPRQPRPGWFRALMHRKWMDFLAHPNVDMIAVTQVVADAVHAASGTGARVIPHAVPGVFFAAGRARAERTEGILKLLYVGEVSEKKGIRVLLTMMEAFALQGRDISLTVVGDGPLADAVQAAGEDVTFLGPIRDREKLAEIMSRHDVLMLLSQRTSTWEELFGIVIVEALASGLAVVASDHVGPAGILAPVGGVGLHPEDDAAGVAERIGKLAEDRRSLAELRDAQAPVATQYDIETITTRWKEAIVLR